MSWPTKEYCILFHFLFKSKWSTTACVFVMKSKCIISGMFTFNASIIWCLQAIGGAQLLCEQVEIKSTFHIGSILSKPYQRTELRLLQLTAFLTCSYSSQSLLFISFCAIFSHSSQEILASCCILLPTASMLTKTFFTKERIILHRMLLYRMRVFCAFIS